MALDLTKVVGGLDKLVGSPLKNLAVKMGYHRLDVYLTANYPSAWPALCRAAKGWVSLVGALLLAWPVIVQWVVDQLHAQQVAVSDAQAASAMAFGLLVLGIIRKGLKGWLALEFGDEESNVEKLYRGIPQMKDGAVAFKWPADWSIERQQSFVNSYAKLLARGASAAEAASLAGDISSQ